MTTVIMYEWLEQFNRRMIALAQHTVLLLDNFTAHNRALEKMEQENILTHIKV